MFTLAEGESTTGIIEVKRSKFIATVARADDEEAARAVICAAKTTYPDARHHCSAFVISSDEGPARTHSSDDGEPSGTAGPPILEVLVGSDLTDVVAVVTRYFGGTLLGTGGLTRAYSQATREALMEARIVRLEPLEHVEATVPAAAAGRIESEIRREGWVLVQTKWGNEVDIEVAVPEECVETFADLVATHTRATAQIRSLGTKRHEVPAAIS